MTYIALPMGVYVELVITRNILFCSSICLFFLFLSFFYNFIGHANSVPDGSSPRGYNQGLVLGCRLHALCRHISFFLPKFNNFSGARTALPMGVAPEAMNKYLYLVIGSRHFYFVFLDLFLFSKVAPEHLIKNLYLIKGSIIRLTDLCLFQKALALGLRGMSYTIMSRS